MGSKRILLSPVQGEVLGQASQSYSCSEKYEWKKSILHQSDQATREQPDHVATVLLPLDMPDRVEDSMTEPGGYDLHRTREIVSNRYCNIATYGVERLGPSHGHGHSSKTYGPGDGVGEHHLSCCSYCGRHDKYQACQNHSSEWARRSISPEPGPIRSYRRKKSVSIDDVPCCAKGLDRHIQPAGGCRKNYSANKGSGSRNGEYHDDGYLPTKFVDDHFSEIDAARHRSYLCNFQSSSKHIPFHPSHGQSCQRDEVAKAHPKRPVNGFRPIHHKQLELSPNEDFHENIDSCRNLRNAYNGKVVKRKFIKQDFPGKTYNGACAGKYNRNSSRKRNADHLDGKKARKNDKSKRLCCPIEQDQRQQVECYKMRNDSREGNVEITKLVRQDGAKGNFNPKRNATAPSSGSTKWARKNISSPKCSKTIASLHTPNLSQGSEDMDLESDNDGDGCTERGIQHIPVIHTQRDIQLKISDNVSQSEALRQDCLILWRERQLRKDKAAKAGNIMKADHQQTAQRSKMSTGRRVGSGGPAVSSSSESKDGTASECSDQFSSATLSDELQKCDEGRANKKLEQTIKFPSNSKCNKRPQNARAEKKLKCNLKSLPEANPLEIAQPKEKGELVDRRQVPTDHPDSEVVYSSLNGCSDTSKVDHSAVSHCDISAHQNISQQEKNNADSNAGREEKPGVKCEKKAGCHGAKLAEQSTGLYAGPILLDKETVASCSMHGTSKVNALKTPVHEITSTSFDGSILPRGTANMCQKKSIKQSSESYCVDFGNCLDGNDCRDNQQETTYDNVLRKKQECYLLAETEDELNAKARKEDCQPQAHRVEIASNQRTTTEDRASDTIHSGTSEQDDRIRRPSIPDLNFSPSMVSDEDFMAPPEEPVCQVTADSFKPQSICMSLSASLTGPTSKGEQFKQVEGKQGNQAEATNQITREACKDGTSVAATQLQISESNTGPPQLSAAEEGSTSMNALKCALCEFVKGFVKPLWDKGLLSREVHKIVVKKAVDKVAGVWAHSAEIDIPRILCDEAENIRTLVKGYLNMYVGSEVLKKCIPRSSGA